MGVVALITWLAAAGGGLYLLAVWLIEYDREFPSAAKTRLPIPVISAHVLLALTGLALWGGYLLTDRPVLAWAALAVLVAVITLGLTMALRWLRVVRQPAQPAGLSAVAAGGVAADPRDAWHPERDWRSAAPDTASARHVAQAANVPPERTFPVPVVILHGLLAIATLALVALTIFRGS